MKTFKPLAFSLVCGLVASCGAPSTTKSSLNATSDSQVQDWTDPMVVLRGYDIISGNSKGDCTVAGTLDPGIPGADGNIGIWRIDFISNADQLQKAMDVSASAHINAATGSGSAKAKYSSYLQINSYSVYALASVQIEKATQNYRDVKLKSSYENLLNGTNPNKMSQFRTRCGDKFIIGQKSGGEMLALIEIKTSSREEKESISANVKAKARVYSAGASFSSAINSLNEKYELHLSTFKVGGNNDPIPTDPLSIINRAAAFEKEVDERAVPYKAILADYQSLENFPFEDPIATAGAVEVLEKLNASKLLINTQRANVEYVLVNQSEFIGVDATGLTAKLNILNDAENKVLTAARACSQNINNCVLPTDLGDIAFKLPEWRDSTKPKQVMGEHPSCGVEEYNTSTGSVCGVASTVYNAGSDPVCGVKSYDYNLGSGPACGAASYREGRGQVCGKEHSSDFGDGKPLYEACVAAGGTVTRTDGGFGFVLNVCSVDKVCRHESFGVESYKSCVDPSFGISRTNYETCRNAAFGVESVTYNSCQDPSFGVKKYKSCLHD